MGSGFSYYYYFKIRKLLETHTLTDTEIEKETGRQKLIELFEIERAN